MTLLLHGAAGGWDELLIALVAFGVMWIAIKLAGRKPAGQGEDHDDGLDGLAVEQSIEDSAHPPPPPLV